MTPKEKLQTINSLLRDNRLEEAIGEVKQALEIAPSAYLNYFFSNLDQATRNSIAELVDGIDHVAILALPNTDVEKLKALIEAIALTENQQFVPSVIIAKELGALVGKNEVPTMIFKAWGKSRENKKIGIEVFIAQENVATVQSWIDKRIGEHVSLRVKSKEAFDTVLQILDHHNIKWPTFMQNKPILKNETYFDNKLSDTVVRVEFTYAI